MRKLYISISWESRQNRCDKVAPVGTKRLLHRRHNCHFESKLQKCRCQKRKHDDGDNYFRVELVESEKCLS